MKILKKGLISITDIHIGHVILLTVLASVIFPLISSFLDTLSIQNAASHAQRVQKATEAYISDRSDLLIANSTPTNPVIINVKDLIDTSYLPPGYNTKNYFSSTYETRVYQPVPKKLNTMTYLIGGADISQSMRMKLAAAIGSNAGIIENGVAKGTQGAWVQNLSSFGGYNPGNGTVVIAGFYNNGNLVNDYLYRKALPGHPELNTMSTNLNMGDNDINDVNDVNAKGWLRTSGDTGWMNDKHKGGLYMDSAGVIKTTEDTGIYSTGRLTTEEYLELKKVSVVGAACPKNGLVSTDAAGAILSCENRVWRKGSDLQWRVGGTFNVWPGQTVNLGRFKLCVNTYRIDGQEMASTRLEPVDAPDSNGNFMWRASNATQYSSYYMGIHCFI